jgi:hypothetical protein
MRHLNKIIFINSASVNYAEMELHGNIYLTGTQGVGKSTLLRAILFFYNADKNKLGISKRKKNFNDYYFEYQNSYIIYEVVRDDSTFCILLYKVNKKLIFVFFDSEYKKEFFIGKNGQSKEWSDIKKAFGKTIHYDKSVTNGEYKKILYGDNKGLNAKFKKYALIESTQYQNIPRTIQNVLLNSNLEAEFIKNTIVHSISEDEFKIDILNYSENHLKDFKTQIKDIKIWFNKDTKGQIIIKNKADAVIDNNRIFNLLKKEKEELAKNLSSRINYIEREKPDLLVNFSNEKNTLKKLSEEKSNLENSHKKEEQEIISKIDLLKDKLKDSKEKLAEYENKNIKEVIEKVAKKEDLLNEKKSKEEEKQLINLGFEDINQKYDSLITQVNNQKNELINVKNAEINDIKENFIIQKSYFDKSYNKLFEQIKATNEGEKEQVENGLKVLAGDKNSLEIDKAELTHKIFFNDEIKNCKKLEEQFKSEIFKAKGVINDTKKEIIAIQEKGELEQKEIERDAESKIKTGQDKQKILLNEINTIKKNLKQGKSSFYGWLNDTIPNWENTIGKVVDKENVLFDANLNPKKTSKNDDTFFGIELNLNAIDKRVKTVKEYRQEIIELNHKIADIENIITKITENKNKDFDSINNKIIRKIKSLEGVITKNKYTLQQNEKKLKNNEILLKEWKEKSSVEKLNVLKKIKDDLEIISSKKETLNDNLKRIKNSIKSETIKKEKERDGEIKTIEELKNEEIKNINNSILKNNTNSVNRIKELKIQQNSKLDDKGADTERLKNINDKLIIIDKNLIFIDKNETLVIEYKKDKREFFDKVPQFKNDKLYFEKNKDTLVNRQKIECDNLDVKLNQQRDKVEDIEAKTDEFDKDLEKFNKFKKEEIFSSIEYCFSNEINDDLKKTAIFIIDDLTKKYHKSSGKLEELRKSIILFTGEFDKDNIFNFENKLNTDDDYFNFAIKLKEFIEKDKITEFEKRFNERFANIIQQISKETSGLQSKEVEIGKIIQKINTDFANKTFVEAIKKMEIRIQKSSNPVVKLLTQIKEFNDENGSILGGIDLFTSADTGNKNSQAVELLTQLLNEIDEYKHTHLTLSDSFDLEFKIIENDNDSGWVEKISDVGSTGTDILVKAMINISLLNVFKTNASKKTQDFKLHCMMDEIGQLCPNNQKGILRFANERNIFLINGSPYSQNATDYKYTYLLSKEQLKTNSKKYVTKITKLTKKV